MYAVKPLIGAILIGAIKNEINSDFPRNIDFASARIGCGLCVPKRKQNGGLLVRRCRD